MPGYREEAAQVAALRDTLHVGQRGYQRTAIDQQHTTYRLNVAGALGELQFEARYGYAVDEAPRLGGDDGIDFWTVLGTVDVKTALQPARRLHLMHLAGKPWAHLYVLGYAHADLDDATLVGWCFGVTLRASDYTAHEFRGVDAVLPQERLNPMDALDSMFATWERLRQTQPDQYQRQWESWYPGVALPPHTARKYAWTDREPDRPAVPQGPALPGVAPTPVPLV